MSSPQLKPRPRGPRPVLNAGLWLLATVAGMVETRDQHGERLRALRAERIYNFGTSGEAGAAAIARLLEG